MRLGPLILQLCALFIAAALVFAGYAWYRNNQVAAFQERLHRTQGLTLVDILRLMDEAPNTVCTQLQAGFSGAKKVTMYHAAGKTRLDLTDVTAGTVLYEVLDETGLYIWNRSADSILLVPREHLSALGHLFDSDPDAYEPPVYGLTCDVWWKTDENAFRVPANLPINVYGE